MTTRLLILGGTTEARQLAGRIAAMPGYDAVISLAGRTAEPLPQPLPVRTGGFGGAEGLTTLLRDGRFAALVVATHPYAAVIAGNAERAARAASIPAVVMLRPPWQQAAGDDWRHFPDLAGLVAALSGEPSRRLLVTIGRQEAGAFAGAPGHRYLFRSIEPIEPPLPGARYLLERGPFTCESEMALMRSEAIDALVTKNSGGAATSAKLDAARALRLPVLMVARPPPTGLATVPTVDGVLDFLAHHAPPAERGA